MPRREKYCSAEGTSTRNRSPVSTTRRIKGTAKRRSSNALSNTLTAISRRLMPQIILQAQAHCAPLCRRTTQTVLLRSLHYIRGLRTLLAFGDLEFHLVTLLQALVSLRA